jgi:hypothetical protein
MIIEDNNYMTHPDKLPAPPDIPDLEDINIPEQPNKPIDHNDIQAYYVNIGMNL